MPTERLYGDENLKYLIPVKDMTPAQAARVIGENETDCLIEKMNQDRLKALRLRAAEED